MNISIKIDIKTYTESHSKSTLIIRRVEAIYSDLSHLWKIYNLFLPLDFYHFLTQFPSTASPKIRIDLNNSLFDRGKCMADSTSIVPIHKAINTIYK